MIEPSTNQMSSKYSIFETSKREINDEDYWHFVPCTKIKGNEDNMDIQQEIKVGPLNTDQ
jgi:hypothetical protein